MQEHHGVDHLTLLLDWSFLVFLPTRKEARRMRCLKSTFGLFVHSTFNEPLRRIFPEDNEVYASRFLTSMYPLQGLLPNLILVILSSILLRRPPCFTRLGFQKAWVCPMTPFKCGRRDAGSAIINICRSCDFKFQLNKKSQSREHLRTCS